MAAYAAEALAQVVVEPIWTPDDQVTTRAEIERHNQSLRAHMDATRRETFYAMSLVTASAFMAEAFLNVLLALTMQPAIRANDALFEETLRRPWKSKVQNLPLTSMVVRDAPDMGDSRVRNADRLFALRNRIAHSYPDDELAVAHVHFFRSYPILDDGGSFDDFQLATQRLLPSREDAIAAYAAAQRFVEFIGDAVAAPVREQVIFSCSAMPLGWRPDTETFSVPFGVQVARAFFPTDGPRPAEPEDASG
jgi:hypothetical protein